jgi:cystathionine gamma-synthase
VHSVSFGYPGVDGWLDVALARKPGHIYSRSTDPTVDALEKKVRNLEGAEAATSFSSGMAAISNSLYALLSSGDRAVSANNTCGGTSKVSLDFPPRFGIEAALRDTTDHDAIEQAVERGCEVLYLESPTNPTLKVLDLGQLADSAHSVGATVIVDNTLASPINQRPLELGADLVIHSATKFLEGTPMHWAGESAERPLSCATPIVRPVSAWSRRLSVLRQR